MIKNLRDKTIQCVINNHRLLSNVFTVPGSPVNGEASSPPPAINDNRHSGDNLDTILLQLRQVTRERDELRKRLALASPGTTFDDCRCKSWPVCQVAVVVVVVVAVSCYLLVTLFNLPHDYKSVVIHASLFCLNESHQIWDSLLFESAELHWYCLLSLGCLQCWLPCLIILTCLGKCWPCLAERAHWHWRLNKV